MGVIMKLKVTLAFLLWILGPPPIFAQIEAKLAWLDSVPPSERETRLAEAAKKDAEVIVYANLDVSGAKALGDGFMKKYPFVKAHMVHFSGAAIINRVEAEARAGRPASDAMLSGQLGVLALLDKKILARYKSPQRESYREGFKDKEGYWTVGFTNLMVTSYNTRYVKKEEAPRRLEDLLDARWKGRMAMDTQSYGWFGAVLQFMGEQEGLRFMRRLNDQNLTHIRGRRSMNELLAAGEFEMAVETNLNSVLTLSARGAPLWFAPIRPLFLSPSLLYMTQNAPHPNAGALFVDYVLSEEGQRIILSTNRMPAHPNVKAAEAQLLEGLDIRIADVLAIGTKYAALGKLYREVFPGAK
jgi:ABC-type Fe3+ transport system substrate-binding protein